MREDSKDEEPVPTEEEEEDKPEIKKPQDGEIRVESTEETCGKPNLLRAAADRTKRAAQGTAKTMKGAAGKTARMTENAAKGTMNAAKKVGQLGKHNSKQKNEEEVGEVTIRSKEEVPKKRGVVSFADGTKPENPTEEIPKVAGPASEPKALSSLPKGKIVMGPVLEFLTADATLLWILAMSLAVYPTYQHWQDIIQNQVPLTVLGLWVLVAYTAGQACGFQRSSHKALPYGARVPSAVPTRESLQHVVVPEEAIAVEGDQERVIREETRKGHLLLSKLLGRNSSRLQFRGVRTAYKSTSAGARQAWSNLNRRDSVRKNWEEDNDPTRDSKNRSLMRKLLRDSSLRRIKRADLLKRDNKTELEVSPSKLFDEEEKDAADHSMGGFDLAQYVADSLDDFVIDPFFTLRGMDVFLTDQPDEDMATHPWLIEQGLRDVPTFIVNVLTQWGNICIYFKMPQWCDGWNFQESENDGVEDKAVKVGALSPSRLLYGSMPHKSFLQRFLKGDDDYKNLRMKLIMSVVEAPRVVKMLAPPKREKVVHNEYISVAWKTHNQETTKSGRKLCSVLEATLDCVSKRAIRSMAGIVKNHLVRLSLDVAAVITKPEGQLEEEPHACIGLWRFNHIDVTTAPTLPDRYEEVAESVGHSPDLIRASQLVSLSHADIASISTATIAQEVVA
jgi:hypothetical protein